MYTKPDVTLDVTPDVTPDMTPTQGYLAHQKPPP
eukprot:CAMPEP_0180149066 /NCGR_PEP_ID=MMETSP0986-20121125/20515_1 /TAXON_ID=697907 /ORGANISM="non described non described, Strain CCMP2293" /LENGTH=33 /DNA_ID= /DNA_START= /DNA_END= /DNA_ORIENTATION=